MTAGDAQTASPDPQVLVNNALSKVIDSLKLDPAYLNTPANCPFIIMQKTTQNGGKFWSGKIQPKYLSVWWGKIGTTGQGKMFNHSTMTDTLLDLRKRALGKLREGYSLILNQCKLP